MENLDQISEQLKTEEQRLAKITETRAKIMQALGVAKTELETARKAAEKDAEDSLLEGRVANAGLVNKAAKTEERVHQLHGQAAPANGACARQLAVVVNLQEQIAARRYELLEAEMAGPAIRARELVKELVTLTERITQIGRKYEVWDLSRLVFPEQAGGFVAVGLKMGVLESASALTALQAKYTIPII